MAGKLPKGAIGYAEEMSEEKLAGKHIDGVTGLVFDTEEAYLNHTSPASGHKPTELEHLEKTTTPNIRDVAEAAQKRGADREGEKQHPSTAAQKKKG